MSEKKDKSICIFEPFCAFYCFAKRHVTKLAVTLLTAAALTALYFTIRGILGDHLVDNDPIEWETLFAGVLAAGAALLTVYYLHRQIDEQRRQTDDEKERKSITAKARATSELSALCEYFEKMASYMLTKSANKPEKICRDGFDFLATALENYTEEEKKNSKCLSSFEAELIRQLFLKYQILNARLKDFSKPFFEKEETFFHIKGENQNILESLILCNMITNYLFEILRDTKSDMSPEAIFDSTVRILGFEEVISKIEQQVPKAYDYIRYHEMFKGTPS